MRTANLQVLKSTLYLERLPAAFIPQLISESKDHFAVYGLSVLSALTAQNTLKVSAVSAVRGDLLEEQLNTLLN
ncbi:MAG: hydroxymethylpyrimidine/phosphomethylpyrimidine kinase, partial [Nitrospirae bacterium]|nr:hydroxymethylpyrimidine/phosphomethylpyrimidine kinase [Nitrospirota bacterium]